MKLLKKLVCLSVCGLSASWVLQVLLSVVALGRRLALELVDLGLGLGCRCRTQSTLSDVLFSAVLVARLVPTPVNSWRH